MIWYIGDSHLVFDIQTAKTHAWITEVFDTIDGAKKWMENHPDASLIVEMPNNKEERSKIQEALLRFQDRITAIEDETNHDAGFFWKPPEKIFPKTIMKKMNGSICKIIKSITLWTAEII